MRSWVDAFGGAVFFFLHYLTSSGVNKLAIDQLKANELTS